MVVLQRLGEGLKSDGRIYVTGGATALSYGWREMTIDLDIQASPEPPKFYEVIAKLKESEDVNIELATPDHFVPLLPGWEMRSKFIATFGKTDFYHYDFYMQALSKIERNHPRDQHDVAGMLRDGLVEVDRLQDLFAEVRDQCIKFPNISADVIDKRLKLLS